jgi:hypothetical protein
VATTITSFIVKPLVLDSRLTERIDEWGDFISVDIENTNADLTKIWVRFDQSPFWLRLSDYYDTEVYFRSLELRWDKSQIGRVLYLIIGREFRFRKYRGAVALVADFVDLAKEKTLSTLTSSLVASDYDLLNIDLSVPRTDVLIASNVISLYVAGATSNAEYYIKLFSPDKPPLDNRILVPGATIERLNRANVYLSNPAQPGASLTLLIFIG